MVNRNYKDTIFRMLFSDRKNLLSLYNAINGTSYENPEELEIVTLENAIYMGMKNDLAFIIDTNLFLYEHQSTYTPNMPLRDLFYISAEYQKLVNKKSLYSSALQKIPAPNFIVFYNGEEKKEDRWENCLSEAYENLSGEPKLELGKLYDLIVLAVNEFLGVTKHGAIEIDILLACILRVKTCSKFQKRYDLAVFFHMALCWLKYAGNNFQKGTFSSTVQAQDSYTVSLFYSKGYVLQSPELIVLDFSFDGFKNIVF